MKRTVFLLASLLFLLFLQTPLLVHAQNHNTLSSSTEINLSDALYADLAVRGQLDNVSLVYNDGKSADEVKIDETKHWLPASTVKLFAAMYAYKLINDGKLNLSDTVTIDAKNDVPTELVTTDLPTLLVGDTVTIDRLIRQMITQSDNTAFNQLLDLLGRDNVTTYIQSLGLTQSHVGSKLNLDDSQTQYEYDVPGYGINSTTAEDYAKAFLLIKNNKIPGAKDLFAVLSQQKINNMIPLYLPKTVVCAHKTGDLDPLYHDGGICEDKNQSYVLTVFTNAGDPNLIAHLSEIAYTKNYQLVGKSVATPTVSENLNQPIDQLVMNPPKTTVLGAETINFPVPDITTTDLGITSSDLSLVIPNSKLPHVVIPSDSPFHVISDAWQLAQYAAAIGPQQRMNVALDTAKLRLAEAKDLQTRGKFQQAETIMQSVQNGITILAKDPTVPTNASTQTTIKSISDTRFSLLGNQLQNTTGNEKLALIKQIATQAKETIKNIQPEVPQAMSATSPTNKPLIGTIVAQTPTTITVQTAGGQQITVPTNTNTITVQEKTLTTPNVNTTLTPSETISPSPSITQTPQKKNLVVGSTIALVGSSIDNHFAPSLILTNVPKELAAPQPVIVKKVNTTNNTMVVEENGIYTQVDINQNTSIKGADTNIPLKSIEAGDVVVVHGAPLTQTTPTSQTSPTPTVQQVSPTVTIIPSTVSPKPTQSQPSIIITSLPVSATPKPTASVSTTPEKIHNVTPSTKSLIKPSTVSPTVAKKISPTTKSPVVIQGTSIQVIETKTSVTQPPAPNTTAPKTQNTSQTSQPAPKSQPQQIAPTQTVGTEEKKK